MPWKIGKDILGRRIKNIERRTGDWHVVFWDLSKDYPSITGEVIPMEEAPTPRHAIAIALRRVREKGKKVKLKSVGFVDR